MDTCRVGGPGLFARILSPSQALALSSCLLVRTWERIPFFHLASVNAIQILLYSPRLTDSG